MNKQFLVPMKKTAAAMLTASMLLGVPGFAAVTAVPAGLAAAARSAINAGAAASGAAMLAPMGSAASAPGAAIATLAAPAATALPAAAAAPAAANAALPAAPAAPPAGKTTAASLKGLSGASAGDNAEAAMGQAFDNSADPEKSKGIPLSWVDQMIAGGATDPQSQRLADIVQRVGFRRAAMNREILQAHNDSYTVEVPMGSITDQKQSGRCWLFAGLNMIRSAVIADKLVPNNFEFSQNYLHFFNMLEKSNRHLEEVSRKVYRRSSAADFTSDDRRKAVTPELGDGGWYEFFSFLVSKYGLVPKGVMGETISSEATATMLSELDDSLAATASEMLANAKQYKAGHEANLSAEIQKRGMTRVWKILKTHLGQPPSRFDYRREIKKTVEGRVQTTTAQIKSYTPVEFARDFVKFDPTDYVSVASYPGEKEGTVYEIKNSAIGHSPAGQRDLDKRFLNVSPERMLALTEDSIRAGQAVWFAADVGKDVDNATGIMHPRLFDRDPIYQFSPEEAAPRLTRKQAAYFSRIGANHAMLFTGLDQPDPTKPVIKYKDENSWSATVGNAGVYAAYREWALKYVFEVVVRKNLLNTEESKLWKGKPIQLKDEDFY